MKFTKNGTLGKKPGQTAGLVHNKLQNQLGVEKAAKLVCLFKFLNRTNEMNLEIF